MDLHFIILKVNMIICHGHVKVYERLKDRNYKDEIEPDDPYFVKDNYEPDMQKWIPMMKKETKNLSIYKSISWMAYMLLFCKEKEEEEDEEEEEEEEKKTVILIVVNKTLIHF